MAKPTCTIADCVKPQKHRGWCGMHYQRWQRHGDPMAETIPRFGSLAESWAANTSSGADADGCLVWGGGKTSAGYGLVTARGEQIYAHRYSWERVNGPIAAGFLVDHTCHQPSCVNVAHLRLASRAENGQNRSGAPAGAGVGVRGVSKKREGYRARANKGGVEYYAGTYSTIEEAAKAAEKLRAELFGEFAGRG